jgi:hypothetical protein
VRFGALLTYVWVAFPHRPGGADPSTPLDPVDLAGNTVFALFAFVLIVLAARVVRRTERASSGAAG